MHPSYDLRACTKPPPQFYKWLLHQTRWSLRAHPKKTPNKTKPKNPVGKGLFSFKTNAQEKGPMETIIRQSDPRELVGRLESLLGWERGKRRGTRVVRTEPDELTLHINREVMEWEARQSYLQQHSCQNDRQASPGLWGTGKSHQEQREQPTQRWVDCVWWENRTQSWYHYEGILV